MARDSVSMVPKYFVNGLRIIEKSIYYFKIHILNQFQLLLKFTYANDGRFEVRQEKLGRQIQIELPESLQKLREKVLVQFLFEVR